LRHDPPPAKHFGNIDFPPHSDVTAAGKAIDLSSRES
jgi:hypothetical protein